MLLFASSVDFAKSEGLMLRTLRNDWMRWQRRMIAVRKLRWLDDRLLADIGTRRTDIEDFVQGR